MLSKDRIREAQENVRAYMEEGIIKKMASLDPTILKTYRTNAEESLKVADILYSQKVSYLWVVVSSYYSMYYIANAVLYKSGYKVGSKICHKVTGEALICFVRKKLRESLIEDFEKAQDEALELAGAKADGIIESFEMERTKRSKFQ